MSDLEKQLRSALRRCDPPAGFAERVMAHVDRDAARDSQRSTASWNWWLKLRWAAIPALAAILVFGFWLRGYEQRQQEKEALAAKQQIMLALRITGSKLRMAKAKVKAVEGERLKTENTL
ncbi:MAG TPA: hypothetical protein VFU50_00275 [Terriglobales bacterium]|nr:hypothetical protein [Terriglobales bacterium]